jgi:hypothetical protein
MGSFPEDAVKNIFGRPDEIGPMELTNMVNGAHEGGLLASREEATRHLKDGYRV